MPNADSKNNWIFIFSFSPSSYKDFSINGITQQSAFLTDLKTKTEQYQKMIKQLKTNKVLKLALQDPEAKKSIIETLETLISEIDQSDK